MLCSFNRCQQPPLGHRLKDQLFLSDGKFDPATGADELPRFGIVVSHVIGCPVGDHQCTAFWRGTTRCGGNFIVVLIPVGMVSLAIHGDCHRRRALLLLQ